MISPLIEKSQSIMMPSMADARRRAQPARKREATPDEFKAMAHPLRLRILRLCLHEALTNKEIADRVGENPATTLHHVRRLVATGFLRAERPRTGAKGALEKPYRATRKSWTLSTEKFPADRRLAGELAMIDAFRAELIDSGADSVLELDRLGLKLGQAAAAELAERLAALVLELADRPDDPDGEPYGLLIGLHRRL
jgi:DNA-binding transcriptional ArsR family regulator